MLRIFCASLILLSLCWWQQAQAAVTEPALLESDFKDGASGWSPIENAHVSDVARRTGGKSLQIRQTKPGEEVSAWLSPVLSSTRPAVRVSLWAADNYDTQQDPSYAASFEVVPCDKDGKLTSAGGEWTYLPWEDKRQMGQFRHVQTPEGLQWKHYSTVRKTGGGFFRVRLCWPKPLMTGECYFTDVRVVAAEEAQTATTGSTGTTATSSRFAFEISTAANSNLFYSDDQLRFEFLLYATDGKPVGTLKKPVIRYDITDYERFHVAAGSLPFDAAKTVVLPSHVDARRTQNLRLSALIPDAAAAETGREFFIHAQLVDGDVVLAEDTVTYAVVNPRKQEDLSKSRFVAFGDGGGITDSTSKHDHQFLSVKTGNSLTQTWDYSGWKDCQPVKDGPITIPRGPDFPKLVYCPNLEQIRGRMPGHPWGDMTNNAPAWALNDDAFHPGCKGFEIDGYVNYIVAYVRANRHRIVQVVPSGLERFIDVRTLELQRKAYAAIKKEFPDLPVGMMTWSVNNSQAAADQILSEKLYEVADFFDTHVYVSGVDWGAWDNLRREFKKMGIERKLISTEFACVGGNDQLQGSRELITSMLDAHSHDMYRVTYFLQYAGGPNPVLREAYNGDGFQWMQYIARPRVSDSIKDTNWGTGIYGIDQRGDSMTPMLKTTTYYNLVQAIEGADFKCTFKPTERTVAYVYDRGGKTVCYVYLREPNAPVTLALSGAVSYTMQDIYGRNDHVTPSGASLVVASLDPLALIFDGALPALYDPTTAAAALKAVEGGLSLPSIAHGASGTAVLNLPPVFAKPFNARVTATVDGTWPKVAAQQIALTSGTSGKIELPIAVDAAQAAGNYTFTTRIYDGDKLVSVLKQPLHVGEVLTAQMSGAPMTKTQDPAIVVTVRSLADAPRSGTIRIANRSFGSGIEPSVMEQPYSVAPHGSVDVRFVVPREQANLAISYELKATLTDASGFTITCEDDVSFQACVKTTTPITIDGDLTDWKLDELIPIPFEKVLASAPYNPKEFSVRFYSRWDEKNLYFAADITDLTPVSTGINNVGWNDDNIMLCLYPWAWHMGESLNAGYYREHIGPLKNGKANILRVGYVPSGPAKPDGVEIVIKRTATGYIYEWAYSKASIHPQALAAGAAFRLSMSLWDQRKLDKKDDGDWGTYSWLTFSGFNTSVCALPNLWRQFRLVEAAK